MSFRILRGDFECDRAEWSGLLVRFPEWRQDVHFEPGYVQAYARERGGEALCAVYDDGRNWSGEPAPIVQSFVRKDDEIGIAYGYGGPVSLHASTADYIEFQKQLEAWMAREGIRVETCRLHPLYGQHRPASIDAQKSIVFINLLRTVDEDLSKGHAAEVVKAHKGGVRIEERDDIDLFMGLYEGMLDRRGADEKWRFKRTLIEDLRATYPNGFQILVAYVGGMPEAACVLLAKHEVCYYHYAGSAHMPREGAGHKLVLEAAEWAKARGYRNLHLGGGLTNDPNDGLLRFKAGFSKRRAWCYTYRREVKITKCEERSECTI